MKPFTLILAAAFFFSSGIQAQSRSEKAVAAAVEELKEALINPTTEKLSQLVSDELTYGHSSGLIEDKAAFIQALVSGKSDFVSLDLSNQTVQVKRKTALVRHLLQGSILDNNKPGTVKLTVLTVWHKEGGRWKLWARQAARPAS